MLQEGVKTDDMPINIGTGVDISTSDLATQIAAVVGYNGKLYGKLTSLTVPPQVAEFRPIAVHGLEAEDKAERQVLKKPMIGT